MKLSQLHPNEGQINGVPNNPRKITDEEFRKLKKSIYESREFLVARPIIVDEEWNILGGNMRYRAVCALRDEGAKTKDFTFTDEIPDDWVRMVHWTRKKKREFVQKDNESSGETDFELLMAWDAKELADWGISASDLAPAISADDLGLNEGDEQKSEQDFVHFETVKEKRKQLWGREFKSEARTDLREEFLAHYLYGGGYQSIYRRSKEGIALSDIKKEENREYVEVFAQSAYKILKATVSIGNPQAMCIITTPKRRHSGYHFATEVCKRLSELSGIPFEDEVMTCKNHRRLNPVFIKQKEPSQDTYILYDDIITTGSTLQAARDLYPNKNIITIVNVCNRGATH